VSPVSCHDESRTRRDLAGISAVAAMSRGLAGMSRSLAEIRRGRWTRESGVVVPSSPREQEPKTKIAVKLPLLYRTVGQLSHVTLLGSRAKTKAESSHTQGLRSWFSHMDFRFSPICAIGSSQLQHKIALEPEYTHTAETLS